MKYVKGNLLEAQETLIVHGCNGQGVMGAGVAAAIRNKWPGAFKEYKTFQEAYGLALGTYSSYLTDEKKIVVNLITQENYGTSIRQVNYASIAVGFDNIIKDSMVAKQNKGDTSILGIAIPKIGAGLGGGDWEIIEAILEDLEKVWNNYVEFVVYEI